MLAGSARTNGSKFIAGFSGEKSTVRDVFGNVLNDNDRVTVARESEGQGFALAVGIRTRVMNIRNALSHRPCILDPLASPNHFSDDAYRIYNPLRVLDNVRTCRAPRYEANYSR